jgi:prepilin-type N-terminal cleavage/methylation domain-containing protein
MRRAREQTGMGLIELLIAMTVLSVALLALIAAFNSGALTLQRASRISTASALADAQMELYRALAYGAIRLETTAAASADAETAIYRADSARQWPAAMSTGTCTGVPNECNPRRSVTGPDSRSYRIDTYILPFNPAGTRAHKKVTVVVRDGTDLTRVYARVQSIFDAFTGA